MIVPSHVTDRVLVLAERERIDATLCPDTKDIAVLVNNFSLHCEIDGIDTLREFRYEFHCGPVCCR